uniref:PPIase cyclophilin-type domain-containing protein n=1 Tax=Callorhinchus milii TaxID=7868 RepID=A0A4W3JJ82_CALMI
MILLNGGAGLRGRMHFEDGLHADLKFTGAGILAMANAESDTNDSQLLYFHTIFGHVCQGIRVVNRIRMVEIKDGDQLAFHISGIAPNTWHMN